LHKLDTRGLSCPKPVLIVKEAIENNKFELEILTDNNTAKNNITRFLKKNNFKKINYFNECDDIIIKAIK